MCYHSYIIKGNYNIDVLLAFAGKLTLQLDQSSKNVTIAHLQNTLKLR